MPKNVINSNAGLYVMGLLGLVVIAGIFLGAATHWTYNFASTGTTGTAGGTGNATPNPGGVCPNTAQSFLLGAEVINYNNQPPTNSSIAVTWQLYAQGSTSSQATGTTSAAGLNSISTTGSLTNLNCNQNYTYFAGDNVNFLEGVTTINTGTRTSTNYNILLYKYTAPNLYLSNTSIVSTAGQAIVHSVPASSVENQATIQIKATNATDGNAQGSLDVMTFNNLQISSIQGPYPTAASLGLNVPTPSYSFGQNSYYAFVVPQQLHYSYVNFAPVITTTSVFNGNVLNDLGAIGLYQYPITGYIYNAKYVANVAVQPGTTGTAIIAAASPTSAANALVISNSIS